MKNGLKILDTLSARARQEEVPKIDVASQVIFRLSRQAPAPAWPMVLAASCTAVAAAVVLGISLPVAEILNDPLSAFFLLASNVLP
ncbi:MAG TPA: hypothetical protein VLS90_02165 [Thermodesulfobacteriota bacterium]|nr:hypothetical protein [Thermodesulfobacteriota bacterium]